MSVRHRLSFRLNVVEMLTTAKHLLHSLRRTTRRAVSASKFPMPNYGLLRTLKFSNPGMLEDSNIALFQHCLARLPDESPVIEIGSFCGLSLNTIIYMMTMNNRANAVFSVDAWHFEGAREHGCIPESDVTFSEYRNHIIETFRRSVTLFSRNRLPHHIVKDSDEFFRSWRAREQVTDFFGREVTLGGPIAMAYIDGDHSYQQSKRDFEHCDEFLVPGGFIIFDDSDDGSGWGSNRTAREAAKHLGYRLVARNPHYCVQKISSAGSPGAP